MTLLLASWAGAAVVVCRWIWAASRDQSGPDEAATLDRVRTAAELKSSPL